MLHFTCGSCGKSLQANEEHAGKKTQCPKCHLLVLIPGEPLSHDRDHVEQDPADETNKPIPISEELPEEQGVEPIPTLLSELRGPYVSTRPNKEPWYYSLIGAVATGTVVLSIIGSIVTIFVVLIVGVRAFIMTKDFGMVIGGVTFGLLVLAWLIGFLFLWSFVLLLLDMARNIRAIKLKLST